MSKIALICILILVFQLALLNKSSAQKTIKLDDVESFTLVTQGGMGSAYRKIEVTRNNKQWESHQMAISGWKFNGKTDSTKKFIRVIPDQFLEQLLNIIKKPDTGILIVPFNIKTQELTQNIDSVVPALKSIYKKEIIDSLQNRAILYDALYKTMHPFLMDDITSNAIFITMKNGIELKADASSVASYNLPWIINDIKCYNPNISLIYNYISGNKLYPAQERKWFIRGLVGNIYQDNFMTRFSWDDLKNDQPKSYAIIKDTFYPIKLRGNTVGSNGYLGSKQLPGNVQISVGFYNSDTVEFKKLVLYNDTLTKIFAQNNFLFRYMRSRPDAKMIFYPQRVMKHYHNVRKYYKKVDSVSLEKAQFIKITGAKDIESRWILLPGNKLILLEFYNIIDSGNNKPGFMNIARDILGPNLYGRGTLKHVCIVFDEHGAILQNTQQAYMFIFDGIN